MNAPLLEVQPRELKFIFELKKQSSCEVRLTNNTFHSVAFKIKTTSPKKYCVRPNVGIVLPKSTCEFVVTMQAPKTVPSEIICKDKFLIQSTVVPAGTTDQDITPLTFNKAEGKLIEEIKLRVVLISPPQSPVLSPIKGARNQGPLFDPSVLGDQILTEIDNNAKVQSVVKNEKDVEMKTKKDVNSVEDFKPETASVLPNTDVFRSTELNLVTDEKFKQEKDIADDKFTKDAESPIPVNRVQDTFFDQMIKGAEVPVMTAADKPLIDPVTKNVRFSLPQNTEKAAIVDNWVKGAKFSLPDAAEKGSTFDSRLKDAELPLPKAEKTVKNAESVTVKAVDESKLVSDIEEMKSKLNHLEAKLNEAESVISKLTVERKVNIQERTNLHEELALLRSRSNAKKVQVGFPLLFVVMVALVSMFLGYRSHP